MVNMILLLLALVRGRGGDSEAGSGDGNAGAIALASAGANASANGEGGGSDGAIETHTSDHWCNGFRWLASPTAAGGLLAMQALVDGLLTLWIEVIQD